MGLDDMKGQVGGSSEREEWKTIEGPQGKDPVDYFFPTLVKASKTENVQAEVYGIMVRLPKGADQDTVDTAIKGWRSAYEKSLDEKKTE